MDKSLEDIQIELEAEQVQQGVDKYRREVAKAKEKGTEKTLKPQQSILHKTIPLVAKGIEEARQAYYRTTPMAVSITKNIDPDVLAFIVCTEIINNMTQQVTVQTVSNKIASAIKDYILLEDFKENCGGLYRYAIDKVNTGNVKHKRNALRHYAKFGGTDTPEMGNILLVGRWFLNLFMKEANGIIDIYLEKTGKHNTPQKIMPTEQTLKWIETQHNFYEDQFPKNMPMVVKPYQWTNGHDGGYRLSVYPLIKYKSEAQMAEVNQKYFMDRVYKAINTVQETAWKINVDVLNVLHEFYDNKIQSVLVPGIFEGIKPAMPCADDTESILKYKDDHPVEWQTWKNENTAYHTKIKHAGSHKYMLERQVQLADKFKDFDELYFPHNCDFRGRIYPLVPILNPQGNDLSKALLHFSYGVPIGEHGDRWLKIHMANSYGNDKVSLDERVKWAEKNEIAFMMIAKDPMAMRSAWETCDSPWQYLAACFEYARYKSSGEGENFVSTLAVGLDGSCNGIQHLASVVKDEVSGKQVNLVPSDKPSDVYQEVCDVVERNISTMNNTYSNMWKGKVTRKCLKQNVMTFAYGSTHKGRQNQIRDYLRKQADKGTPVFDFPKSMSRTDRRNLEWNLVMFLATESGKAIDEVLIGPRQTMDWFKSIVREYNKDKQAMTWVTPVGFPVVQDYRKLQTKSLDTNFDGIRIRAKRIQETEKLDVKKCSSGFAPNIIHSYDSAHLMMTLNRLADMGIKDFGVVHDSFATHLGHVQELSDQLRLTFIEMYRGNVAESMWQEFQEGLGRALPKPIEPGHLDITRIMESDYFFN